MHRFDPVDRRKGLSVREFKHEYFNANRPVVVADAMDEWKARSSWSFENLKARFGKHIVEVFLFENGAYRPDRVQKIPLADYIDKILVSDSNSYPYYLRDNFSLFREYKDLWGDFTMPKYCFDWYKLLPSFVLRPGPRIFMGPKGAVTTLHQDMWGTHFWNGNLQGKKRWILFAPDQKQFLYESAANKANSVLRFDVQPDNPDLERFPLFQKAKGLECTVGPGEMIIVPSNWIHWVVSLDATISLTHNYMGPGNFRPALAGQLKWYLETRRTV